MAAPVQTCYRHADRRAGVSCQRCGRPICPHCMTQASVGFHCPDCLRGTRQRVVTADALRQRTVPLVTKILLAVNVGVFLVDWALHGDPSQAVEGSFVDRGGLDAASVTAGEWYRIITSGFLHLGTAHIGLNMLSLVFIGMQLEPVMGRARFAISYTVGLVAGSFGALLLEPQDFTVGASGAIFGLFGVIVALQASRRVNIWQSGIGGLLLLNILFTFTPGISKGAHFGGLAGGLLVGAVFFWLEPRLPERSMSLVVGVALVAVLFAGCLAIA
jgi:membrane associated rhomboid family serine protease